MTATDLAAAAHAVDKRRSRSRQRKMGPSSIGDCRRKAAYMVAGTPPTDEGGTKMAAILGTWIHKGALEALRREYGAVIEFPVENDVIKGSLDAMYLDARSLEDVKTVGRFVFEWRQQVGAAVEHLFQTHIYAWLLREGFIPKRGIARLRRLGYEGDRVPIETIVIRYVNRDNGEEFIHSQDYDPAITAKALEWLAGVHEVVFESELGPDGAQRDHDGPGLSVICDSCRWLTACWGPQPEVPWNQWATRQAAQLIRDDSDVEAALQEYDQARAVIKEAEGLRDLAKAKLTASTPAQYGELVLGWSKESSRSGPDMEKIGELFAAAGLEVPVKQGKPFRTISVKRAKPAVS